MCYTSGKELNVCYSSNVLTECNYYPTSGKYAIVNNSNQAQTTDFYDINGNKQTVVLAPMEIKWIKG
jgi:1,3-beta-galactosyl-N-acetylhexosamine phosphorylase